VVTAGFLKRVRVGLPFVTLKLAASVDGRTATATGESRWITGPDARRMVHAMRLRHDAVMIGVGTALADDPDLTARDMGATHQPVRIVMDRQLRTSVTSRLGQTAGDTPVWMIHGDTASAAARVAWDRAGARLIQAGDATTALQALAAAGLTRVLCEGGAGLAAGLLQAALVDELVLFTAGAAIGADGHPALGPLGLAVLKDAPRMQLRDLQRIGDDTCSIWVPQS
jgi:diaminohydroxyphosphoribosylaminopyrimidine deaminase / 5-amino-6-(5-phosphoribosylamino)uracil reductase